MDIVINVPTIKSGISSFLNHLMNWSITLVIIIISLSVSLLVVRITH